MEVSSLNQLLVFFASVGAGIMCGMFFDLQRIMRKKFTAGKYRTFFEDLVFAIFCVLSLIFVGVVFDDGAIRYYLLAGSISGALFYASVLSLFFRKILEYILEFSENFIVRPLKKTARFLWTPVRKLWRLRKKISLLRKKIIRKISDRVKRRVKRLKKRIKML